MIPSIEEGRKEDGNRSITRDQVKLNARFVTDIGHLITDKVPEMQVFNRAQTSIRVSSENIGLLFENELHYKYKLGAPIWKNGMNFGEFVKLLIGLK